MGPSLVAFGHSLIHATHDLYIQLAQDFHVGHHTRHTESKFHVVEHA